MQDAFTKLVQLMARLRGPDGCPWDRAQTANSLRPFLIEECYEVVDALDEGDPGKMKEELGDLLFQIIFHSRIAEEKGEFTISDVITANTEKMVRRHPHVFGDAVLATDREVLANWEQIKRQEKGHQDRTSMLEGVPRSLPALRPVSDLTGHGPRRCSKSWMRRSGSSRKPLHKGMPWPWKMSWETFCSCS